MPASTLSLNSAHLPMETMGESDRRGRNSFIFTPIDLGSLPLQEYIGRDLAFQKSEGPHSKPDIYPTRLNQKSLFYNRESKGFHSPLTLRMRLDEKQTRNDKSSWDLVSRQNRVERLLIDEGLRLACAPYQGER